MSDVIQFPEHESPSGPDELPAEIAGAFTGDATRPAEAPSGLVVIGVPPGYAALEAHRALGAGADVMLVSEGVTVEDEVVLKRRAREAGLLLMGPGCATAIIDGIGIGFANVVTSGRVGVVATSGDAAQEATVLLDGPIPLGRQSFRRMLGILALAWRLKVWRPTHGYMPCSEQRASCWSAAAHRRPTQYPQQQPGGPIPHGLLAAAWRNCTRTAGLLVTLFVPPRPLRPAGVWAMNDERPAGAGLS